MLLYEDESHFRDSQTLHSTWFLKGKQKKVPVLGKHHALSIFGTVNVNTGDFLCAKADKCNAETFQAFLEYVLEKYENNHVVLVLDNARYHHAKILKPFFKEHEERLTLIYLPPYSPNLNLIERVWKLMKDTILANRYYEKIEDLVQAMKDFCRDVKQYPQKVLSRVQKVDMSIF